MDFRKPRPEANSGQLGRNAFIGAAGLGFLASVLVLGLIVVQSYREREALVESEKDSLSRLAQIVAVEMGDMFDKIRFFFKAADLWLSVHPAADPRSDPGFERLTEDFRAAMGEGIDVRLVSESGGIYDVPSGGKEPIADVGDRAYFLAQRSPGTRGFFIAEPVLGRVTKNWVIPISYPLSGGSSGMAVILVSLELRSLEELYEKVRPKPGGSISLVRRDGRFLARIPFDEVYMSRRVAEDPDRWWTDIQETPILVMRAVATDQEERIIATKTIRDPDMAVSVSARMDDVISGWRAGLRWRIATALGLIGVIGLFSARLLSAMRKANAAQGELARSVERLRESDATKDKLFSILAHDLRGPVGGICNLLDTMAQDLGQISAQELEQYLSALRVGAWNTYQLLENILAWSRSKRGDMTFRPERTKVRPLVDECSAVYALAMKSKRLRLVVDVDPGLEARTDPDLLKVVLRNLISNAIKFTASGGSIAISGRRACPAGDAEGGTSLTVRDEGVGMDPETKAGLFIPGGSRSRSGTASEGGSGLGLVLCRDIAALHGGRIDVESETDAGSAFTVFLPD